MIFESTVFNFRWVLFKNNCYIFTKTTMKTNITACIATILLLMACSTPYKPEETISTTFHQDVPFMQDYSIKYYSARKDAILQKAFADRNGIIQVLSQDGLLKTHGGRLLYPGKLIDDRTHRPLTDNQINDLTIIDQQFVYLGDEAVFSNAWAGKLFVPHSLPNACVFDGSPTLVFLVSDGYEIHFLTQKDPPRQYQSADGKVLDIRYDLDTKNFWILAENAVFKFDPKTMKLEKQFEGLGFTAFAIAKGQVIVGTDKGHLTFDQNTGKPVGDKQSKLPWPEITAIEIIDGNCWFGSTRGAFMINDKGTINYYYGERWLPGNRVLHLSEGNDSTILILTDRGLGQIVMEEMTLEEKASYFENQVCRRHIRYGFNAGLVDMEKWNADKNLIIMKKLTA
jgi:ligand-binding sensor domain-containing protein